MTDITDEMVNAATRELWNDLYSQHGGHWESRDAKEVCVIQLKATMRAALKAALAANNQEAWVAALLNSPNPALAATPAVGEEREALVDACMRLQSFLDTFGDVGGCETQADLNDWLAIAQPAQPAVGGEPGLSLRGRASASHPEQPSAGSLERLSVEKLARHFKVSVADAQAAQDDIGFMYRELASPPEQPAAAPEMFRCNCPFEVRSGCSEPKCPHYVKPRRSSGEPIREDNYMSNDLDKGSEA